MQSQQHSGSLQIIQHHHQILQISKNSINLFKQISKKSQKEENNQDTFELSLDENSFSLHIQLIQQDNIHKPQQKQQIIEQNQMKLNKKSTVNIQIKQNNKLLATQEERKKKRKQIFDKYKLPQSQNNQLQLQSSRKSNEFMNTFDQIFSIRSPSMVQKKSQKTQIDRQSEQKNSRFFKKQVIEQNFITQFNIIPRVQAVNSQIYHQSPFKFKKTTCQNRQSFDEFSLPSKVSSIAFNEQGTVAINATNSFMLEQQNHRFSIIESLAYQQQMSRDSVDLESILQSQIFKDEVLNNTIQMNDVTYKNFEVSAVNPSLLMSTRQQDNKINPLMRFQQRFSMNKDKSPQNMHKNSQQKSLSQTNINMVTKPIIKYQVTNQVQSRIPVFLREVRKRNTVIPNFFIHTKNSNIFIKENQTFKQLLFEFKKAVQFLNQINDSAFQTSVIYKQMQAKLMNSLTLHEFLTNGWEKVNTVRQIQNLRPHENFIKRPYQYIKVKQALSNYLQIVKYYQKYNLNLMEPKAQKKYFQMRNKFWQIEKNIKMISQDIYTQIITQGFPRHYYQFLRILKNQTIGLAQSEKVQYLRNILIQYSTLKNTGDLLCLSEIGRKLKQTIQKLLQSEF